MAEQYYTYFHRRASDNTIFYVGKGKGRRAWRKNRSEYWKRIVAKHGLIIEICAHWDTEAEAFEHEKALIEKLRAEGCKLCNLTDGGEGRSGYKWTDEERANRLLVMSNPDVKAKVSAALRAAHARPEVKDKHSTATREALARPEVKAKLSAASRATHARPEVKAKHAAATREALARPEVKAKLSAASRATHARPEVKAKISAAMREALARPEVKAKLSAAASLTKWFTNGETALRLKPTDPIPEGFVPGRKISKELVSLGVAA